MAAYRSSSSASATPKSSASVVVCQRREVASLVSGSRMRAATIASTKLATTRRWHTCTLAEDFGVADADEDDLYAAMDWLLARQIGRAHV